MKTFFATAGILLSYALILSWYWGSGVLIIYFESDVIKFIVANMVTIGWLNIFFVSARELFS